MNIDTKFQIGDFVRPRYSKATAETVQNGLLLAMVVLYIHTETCSAGTQVFYCCRTLYQHRKHDFLQKDNDLVEIGIGSIQPLSNKFREDELQSCPQDIVDLITK